MKYTAFAISAALLASAAHAQEYGDWIVDQLKSERAVYAATMNESGGLLGKTCEHDGCTWVLTVKASCESGSKYPALLSADSGAWHITLICSPNEKNAGRYLIQDFDRIDVAVRTGQGLGFAMPLQSGDFRVTRFLIRGWDAAAKQLALRTAEMLRRPAERTL